MAAFDMTAFSRSASGGLIPQARQGGSSVFPFAVTGSKLVGSGFESEHIGHTHVVARGRKPAVGDTEDTCGLEVLARGDAVELPDERPRGECGPEFPGTI